MYTLAIALIALLHVDASAGVDCDRPSPILAFEAAFSASLAVTLPSDVIAIQLPGIKAAYIKHRIVTEILIEYGVCDADRVAYTVSSAWAKVEVMTATLFFQKIGLDMASFLYKKGKLTCGNAVGLALDFSALVRARSPINDFESLEHAIVYGIVDFLNEKGFPLQKNIMDLANLYYDEVATLAKNSTIPHCPAAKPTF